MGVRMIWAALALVLAAAAAVDAATLATTVKPKMATHQAFLNAGKTAGLEIWRIEVTKLLLWILY